MLRQSLFIALLCFAIPSFGQNVGVTATVGTATGNYSTLLAAFNAINAGTHKGYIVLTLNNNTTETNSCVLNASGSGSALYDSIRITSSGSFSVTGAIAAGNPLIALNGADNVFFEGVNSAGVSLTLSNTTVSSTTGTCTIKLYNDATKNRINKCNVLGSSTMTTTTADGGNIFISTAASTGNDNNTISNCTIGGAGANMPNKGIYLSGTTTNSTTNNDGITISNNNFVNFDGVGIYIYTGNYGVTVSNNNFYHTSAQTVTNPFSAVYMDNANTGINFNVYGNNIGGSAANCGGSAMSITGAVQFQGIYYNGQNSYPASNIYGNRISNISINSSYATLPINHAAIYIYGGRLNCGTQQGNLIGDTTTTGSIVFNNSGTTAANFYGITTLGASSVSGPLIDTIDISNNRISGINLTSSSATVSTGLRCIYLNGTSIVNPYFTVNNNLIGSNSTANSISCSSTNNFNGIQSVFTATTVTMTHQIKNNTINNLYYGGGALNSSAIIRAIIVSGGANSFNISNNTIKNISSTITNSAGGGASNTPIMGINISVSGTSTISGNQIYNLSTTATAATAGVTGMLVNIGTGSLTISKNRIFALNPSSTGAAIITGMYLASGTNAISNNEIGLGLDWSSNSNINPSLIYGIYETAGTNTFYFNSVAIRGTGVSNTSNTWAFYSSSASVRDYRDNVFSNSRSFSSAGATYNYAAQIGGVPSSGTIPNLTCNYNLYYASGTGGMLINNNATNYSTLGTWNAAASSHDANSCSVDPQFYNNTTLKPMNAAVINGVAIGSVTDDIEGASRSNNRIGAYDRLTSLNVNIIGFDGSWLHEDPILHLVTSNESNLSLYTIERSENGNEFVKAGNIQPTNSNFENHYDFSDIYYHGLSNTLYYRVKVAELSGATYYSNTVVVSKNNSNTTTTELAPNPFHETIRLTKGSFVALYDVTGKNCEQMIEISADGTKLQTEKLPVGVYIIKYKNQEGNIESKIINKI